MFNSQVRATKKPTCITTGGYSLLLRFYAAVGVITNSIRIYVGRPGWFEVFRSPANAGSEPGISVVLRTTSMMSKTSNYSCVQGQAALRPLTTLRLFKEHLGEWKRTSAIHNMFRLFYFG